MLVAFVFWSKNSITIHQSIYLAMLTKCTELTCLVKSANLLEYDFGNLAIFYIVIIL